MKMEGMPPIVEYLEKIPNNGKLNKINAKIDKPMSFDCLLAIVFKSMNVIVLK
jgi:hypothetical protein